VIIYGQHLLQTLLAALLVEIKSMKKIGLPIVLVLLGWVTINIVYKLITLPAENDLKIVSRTISDIRCSTPRVGKSELLVEISLDVDRVVKRIPGILDCSQEKYANLIGEDLNLLLSSRGDIWGASHDGVVLLTYNRAKKKEIGGGVITLAVIWGLFGVIFFIRRRAKLQRGV
jgi:hypothetical protein